MFLRSLIIFSSIASFGASLTHTWQPVSPVKAAAAGCALAIAGCSAVNTLKTRYFDKPGRVPTNAELFHYESVIAVLATVIAGSSHQALTDKKLTPHLFALATTGTIGIAYAGKQLWKGIDYYLWTKNTSVHHCLEQWPYTRFLVNIPNRFCEKVLEMKTLLARTATIATYAPTESL